MSNLFNYVSQTIEAFMDVIVSPYHYIELELYQYLKSVKVIILYFHYQLRNTQQTMLFVFNFILHFPILTIKAIKYCVIPKVFHVVLRLESHFFNFCLKNIYKNQYG